MDQLIVRVLQGEASPEEKEQLRAWRETSADNERWYQDVAATWEATSTHPAHGDTARPLAHEIITEAESGAARRKPRRPSPLRQVAAVAAALVVGLLIGELRLTTPMGTRSLEAAEFVTGASELATARLSDGTVVRLAPSTRLRVGGRDVAHREVWLDGKAFFAVKSDDSAPFTVRTRAGDALVLGTRFEVDVTSEDLRVLVVEGSVEVGADSQRIKVEAGNRSRTRQGLSPEVAPAQDVRTQLDWMGLFLAFESTPLSQVAREIEDRYGMPVEVTDSALARRTITAWFGDEEPKAILNVICRIADAHCSIRDEFASIEP